MNRGTILAIAALAVAVSAFGDYPIRNAEKTKVRLTHGFWFDWLETNRLVTLKTCSAKLHLNGGIRANEKVAADRGRLAVERGPIVYCAEGADNAGGLIDAKLPADATFAVEAFAIGDKKFPALCASNGLLLVPYSLWGNRKPGNEMQT